jgi:calcineurin-like phosphoesterase family protein
MFFFLTVIKIFVIGNHDKCYSYAWWNTAGFDMVCAYPVIVV